MMSNEWRRGDYLISDDPARIDIAVVHGFLRKSYWAEGIPEAIVRRSIAHSLVLGVYRGDRQVGFARVVTDRATFAYLADVFVIENERGSGLGKWLVATVLEHPDLQGLRRIMLATRDAHELYRQFGFRELQSPERFMEIWNQGLYRRPGEHEE